MRAAPLAALCPRRVHMSCQAPPPLRGLSAAVCALRQEILFKKAQRVFKALYDCDLLPEEAILLWHATPPASDGGVRVREAVAPFVAWLQEAEEDSDE